MKRGKRFRYIAVFLAVVAFAGASPLLVVAQGDSGDVIDTLSATDTDTVHIVKDAVVVYDSSSFTPRSIPAGELDAYRRDKAFDYAREAAPPSNVLERILEWIFELLRSLFGNETGRAVFQYGIFAAALILVIVLLMRSELAGVFKRAIGKKGKIEFEEVEEDISRMNFDTLIAEAIAAGNLRRAVRLHYLKLLRDMTEGGLIEWRREKTNSDYLYELQRQDLRPRFAELTRIFDFVWYGGFEIDSAHYRRISEGFNDFTRTVEGRS